MSRLTESIRSYFEATHSLLYSYLVSLPLLLLYEILIFISQPNSDQVVRISVDVWIKTLFSYFGKDLLSITLIIVALLGIFVLYRERKRLKTLHFSYFLAMLAEAAIYAFFLALLISEAIEGLLQVVLQDPIESLSVLQQFALSLGAGLYEELFFRVLLVSALLYLFTWLIEKKWLASATAMVVAALIFSGVHYIGVFGDPFTVSTFLFRFLFGLALNGIYIYRGFGMAAWTHATYDMMVIAYM